MNARTSTGAGIPNSATRGYGRPMEFRVLGAIEVVENGDGPIPLGGPKQRAVLARVNATENEIVT